MERIPFCSPSISERDVQYVADSVPRCADDTASEVQHRFEHAFAQYIGVRHATMVSSRTAAIHVTTAALGIASGHEVIVPDIMPAVLLAPLRYVGATPVFVDIDSQTWCLSADAFRQAITPRTKAVLAMDLYGNVPDMPRIRAIAHAKGIAVIEDATDALGGEYLGRRAGSLGDIGVFGFDRTETLTSGEGGMIVTDCDRLAARIQASLGDYQISPMQAALAASQLERIDDLIARKRQIAAWYRQSLGDLNDVTLSSPAPRTQCVSNEVALTIDPTTDLTGELVVEELSHQGIECREMFPPVSSLAGYAETPQGRVARGRNRASYAISPHGIALPSGTNLTRRQVEHVAGVLKGVVARRGSLQPRLKMAA